MTDTSTATSPITDEMLAAIPDPEPTAPAPTAGPQEVSVTAVMPDIDSAIALRARIKALQTDLKAHEQAIKDVLGNAVSGVDSTGKVVVSQPIRNRSNFDKKKAAAFLTPEQFAACETHSTYRPLLFDGE